MSSPAEHSSHTHSKPMRRHRWFLGLLLASALPALHAAPLDLATVMSGFEGGMRAQAYGVEHGDLRPYSVLRCVTTQTQCFGNNPSSPYLYVNFSAPPGVEVEEQPDHWTLARNEAVVLLGFTPPPMRYFAYTGYLFDRFAGPGAERTLLAASLGPSLNHLRLHTAGSPQAGESVAGQFTAIVATADLRTYIDVKKALLRIDGIDKTMVNPLPMTSQARVRYGHGQRADTFSIIVRTALPEDPAALDAYIADVPMQVVRVTPQGAHTTIPLPGLPDKDPATGVHETTLDPSLTARRDALAQAVLSRYGAGREHTEFELARTFNVTGRFCIDNEKFCVLNNQDAIYTWDTPEPLRMGHDPDEFLLVVGVDHRAYGKAVYTNHSIYKDGYNRVGVTSVPSDNFAGSADYHKGQAPVDTSGLYAYKFAFNCNGEPYCLEIPSSIDDPLLGLEAGEPFTLAARIYLNPETKIYPDIDELVLHRVFHFRPAAR